MDAVYSIEPGYIIYIGLTVIDGVISPDTFTNILFVYKGGIYSLFCIIPFV